MGSGFRALGLRLSHSQKQARLLVVRSPQKRFKVWGFGFRFYGFGDFFPSRIAKDQSPQARSVGDFGDLGFRVSGLQFRA